MKTIIFALVFCLSSLSFASGKLVAGGYYLDDTTQAVAPTLGLQLDESVWGLTLSSYVGGGLIPQADPNAPNTFARAAADLSLAVGSTWSVGVGGGVESAKSVNHQLDDYAHLTVSCKLW